MSNTKKISLTALFATMAILGTAGTTANSLGFAKSPINEVSSSAVSKNAPLTTSETRLSLKQIDDQANLLSTDQQRGILAINQRLLNIRHQPKIFLLTVLNLNGQNAGTYAQQVFNSNKFATNPYSALILIDLQEKIVRIQVGKGLKADKFSPSKIVPSAAKTDLSEGNFAGGVLAIAQQTEKRLDQLNDQEQTIEVAHKINKDKTTAGDYITYSVAGVTLLMLITILAGATVVAVKTRKSLKRSLDGALNPNAKIVYSPSVSDKDDQKKSD